MLQCFQTYFRGRNVSSLNHIKNPLTIVGIFAGIVEVSANLVLPFLNDENQSVYVWFLMLFPAGLVAIFFALLNWNHAVLYAPSDYQNDDSFVKVLIKQNLKLSGNEIDDASEFKVTLGS